MTAKSYVDEHAHACEIQRLFAPAWHLALPAERLRNVGDQVPVTVAGIPTLLVRGEDNVARAFRNICPHRGYPLALGRCRRQTIQCGYHGWSWRLDGRLRSAPNFAGCEVGLDEFRVEEWNSLLFVSLGSSDGDFNDWLSDAATILDDIDVALVDYEWLGASSHVIHANWKLWVENALECYHCATIHPHTFAASIDTRFDHYGVTYAGKAIAQVGRFRPESDLAEDEKLMRQVHLWPASFLSVDGVVAMAGTIEPARPDESVVHTHTFVRRGAPAVNVRRRLTMYAETAAEDQTAIELVQSNHSAVPDLCLVGYSPSEAGIQHFDSLWRAYMAEA